MASTYGQVVYENDTNFLSMLDNDIKLSDDECVYLNAAELGDSEIVKECLQIPNLNVNCVDYMGRNALLLAIGTENLELIDILLDHLNFWAIEDALLHVISQNRVTIVKLIIDHERYIKQEHLRGKMKGERSQFSPDITPLILAAHYGNHEIIQLFLSRNKFIERPHPVMCMCDTCVKEIEEDSLNFARSRLNKYKAFASPAYMALASPDPISTTFHLRQELKVLAKYQIEFRKEYQELMNNCMTFAYDILDSCRTSKEVNALLTDSHHPDMPDDPLGTLKKAVDNEEKAFVSHPNCQHQLAQLYYGQAGSLLQFGSTKQYLFLALLCPLLPFMCIAFLIVPDAECLQIIKCPVVKFINHTLSNCVFLILLAAATFGVEGEVPDGVDMTWEDTASVLYSYDFRVTTQLMLDVQILCLFWVLGHAVSEINQLYSQGLKGYFDSYYNYVDSLCISIYMASYALRLITQYNVNMVAERYAAPLARAREIIFNKTMFYEPAYSFEYYKIVKDLFDEPDSYFLRGARIWWDPYDPQTVSDCLFAIANVMSFARVTYILPAFESLGPLQLSLGRMLGDITRFLALFVMIAIAFVVGMTNLYHYYRNYLIDWNKAQNELVMGTGIHGFKNLKHTMLTLYWALFGMTERDVVEVVDRTSRAATSYLVNPGSTQVLETVGSLLFCIYCGLKIIILLNMLIAMMSQSFEEIQADADQEWKFARTRLWLSYVDEGEVVPTPFNILPTRTTILALYRWCKCSRIRWRKTSPLDDKNEIDFEDKLSTDTQDSHTELRKNLVRRYLFRLQRENEMKPTDTKDVIEDEVLSATPSETNLETGSQAGEHARRSGPSNARRRLLLSGGRATGAGEEGAEPSAVSRLLRQPTKKPTPVPTPQPSIKSETPPLTPSRMVKTLPRYSSRDPLEESEFAPIAEEESSVVTFLDDDDRSLRSITV